jgi:hypothetical protein
MRVLATLWTKDGFDFHPRAVPAAAHFYFPGVLLDQGQAQRLLYGRTTLWVGLRKGSQM